MGRTVRPRSGSGAGGGRVKGPGGGPTRSGGWGRRRLWPKATQPETATRGSPYEGPGVGGAPFRAVLGRRDFGARSYRTGRAGCGEALRAVSEAVGVGGLCGRQGYEALPAVIGAGGHERVVTAVFRGGVAGGGGQG